MQTPESKQGAAFKERNLWSMEHTVAFCVLQPQFSILCTTKRMPRTAHFIPATVTHRHSRIAL